MPRIDHGRIEVRTGAGFDMLILGQVLVEIQTSNFSSQRRKLETLIEKHPFGTDFSR
jgi:hypothetical protein